MANEDVNVLSLKVDLSGQTIGELRDGLKELKKVMNEAEIGTDDFVEASKALQAQETLLKEAMYEQKKAADDVGKSYNTLSAEMGRLKVEQKQLDLSTEAGVKAWDEYAVRINAINDELKALDATNGVYVRNVGDYANQFGKGFAEIAQNMPKWADNVKKPIDDIGKSAKLLATNPVVGVVTLLLPVITKITDGLKDNEQAMAGVHKMLEAVKPVLNILTGDLAGEGTGTFKTIVTGAVGVGNAMLQFILTPIRTIIEAAKGLGHVFKDIFSGQFKQAAEDAKTALSGIGDAFTKGFSFKANFEEGQRVGEEFAAGLKSERVKTSAKGAAREVAHRGDKQVPGEGGQDRRGTPQADGGDSLRDRGGGAGPCRRDRCHLGGELQGRAGPGEGARGGEEGGLHGGEGHRGRPRVDPRSTRRAGREGGEGREGAAHRVRHDGHDPGRGHRLFHRPEPRPHRRSHRGRRERRSRRGRRAGEHRQDKGYPGQQERRRQRAPGGEHGLRHGASFRPPRRRRSTISAIAPSPVKLHAVPMPSRAM